MKLLISWTMCVLLVGGLLGSCRAWAQQGNPTAAPPGGANSPGTAGSAGTTQPAGTAGSTFSPGGTVPSGTTGLSSPAMRQSLGGSSGLFRQGQAEAGTGGRSPAQALPGRANFSGGSTSRSLRPAGPITGGPNNTNNFIPPLTTRTNAFNPNLPFPGAMRSAINAPLAPVVPIVPVAPVAPSAQTAPVAPVVRNATIAPIIVLPSDAQASGRSGVEASVPVAPREAPLDQGGVATATAFPSRNPTATGDATVTASPPAGTRVVQSQWVEIPTGRVDHTTAYRGNPSAVAQRGGLTYSYPGYTQWQGYYWYHSPAAGWHYWDGLSWVQFERAQASTTTSPN